MKNEISILMEQWQFLLIRHKVMEAKMGSLHRHHHRWSVLPSQNFAPMLLSKNMILLQLRERKKKS